MSSYESKDIQALGDLQAIRTRPGMYIGDTTHPGQLFTEGIDNALDEVQAGFSDKVVVIIDSKNNRYHIRDYGRGIPIGKTTYVDSVSGESHSIETLQLVYFKAHAGGKFGANSAYKKSRGLHGVGSKCINALSEYAKVVTIRDGKSVELEMSKGNLISLNYVDTTEPNGVNLEFTPDKDIFESPIIPDSYILEISGISNAFGLNVEVFKDGVQLELPYKDIFDLLPTYSGEHELLRTDFNVVNAATTESFRVAMKYTSDTNAIYRGYTNMIYNSSGGNHVKFFEECYKQAWMKYLDDEFKIQDVLIGLRALVGVAISNEQMAFAGQTKERLSTPKTYFEPFRTLLIEKIQEYFDNNESIRKGLIKRFKEYRASQNKLLATKELSQIIYVNDQPANGNGVRRKSVVDKLRECTSKTQAGTSLIICEGDSAAGTLIQARNIMYHAILPIRGKILNVAKRSSYIECMKNEEVKSIVNSAGTGIGADCDHTKSRYEKYLIFTDADEDGANIASLLISIFVNLLPDLVTAGMVYVVEPPLYSWTDKGKQFYTRNLKDVTNPSTMTRFKGLGEMDSEDMKVCLDPATQELIQVEFPTNIDDFNESMTSAAQRYKILDSMGLIKEISI